MTELRLFLRRDSLRAVDEVAWVLRAADGRTLASGNALDGLPKAERCHLVLAADLVGMVPATLPDWPERKLQPLLASAAEAHTVGDAEHLHVVLLGRGEADVAWLAVIDRDWLQYTLAQLEARGLKVDAALPEYLLLPHEKDAWTVLRHEEGVLLRAASTFGLALDQGDPPTGLALALARAADCGLAAPRRLIVCQGNAVHAPDPAQWQEKFGLPVELRGNWHWREANWPKGSQLLGGRFQPRHTGLDVRALLKPVLVGVLLLAVIQLSGALIDWGRLAGEERQLRAGMQQLAASVLPTGAAIVDPVWQVGEVLKSLGTSQHGKTDGPLMLLSEAGRLRPSGLGSELIGIDYASGQLKLEYRHADPVWLGRYVSALQAKGLQVVQSASDGTSSLLIRVAEESSGQGAGHGR